MLYHIKGAQNLYDFAPKNYTSLKLIAQKLYELKSSGRRIEAGFASYNFWAAKSYNFWAIGFALYNFWAPFMLKN